jgi:hypothetical protein
MLLTDGSGTVSWGAQPVAGLPSQTSNSGRLLTTNGSTASWSNAVTVSGSNATVGGTLTVGRDGSLVSAYLTGAIRLDDTTSFFIDTRATDGGNIVFRPRTSAALTLTAATNAATFTGAVSVSSTTASASYNSGALVVSGGVGIAGALYSQQNSNAIVTGTNFANTNAGNAATIRHTLTAGANNSTIEAYSDGHATFAGRLRFGTNNGQIDFVPSGVLGMSISAAAVTVPNTLAVTTTGFTQTITGNEIRLSRNSFNYISLDGGTSASLRFNGTTTTAGDTGIFNLTNTQVAVLPTTASNSTSSGALVVSGGVGVAKRIYSGEGLDTAGDNSTHISFVRNGTVSIGPDSAATPALVVSTAIKTSAPSGGTAANWKLGTVATVSPTSPNRTIEVEIGGTTYYLHAKTTNN